MKEYTVRIKVSECQEDTFQIEAPDLETAQRNAMTDAVERGYEIDDVIDVEESEESDISGYITIQYRNGKKCMGYGYYF